jgi:pimeloyl-ACP methyl ester carboxylesterase
MTPITYRSTDVNDLRVFYWESGHPDAPKLALTDVLDGFTDAVGFDGYALYVLDYGAPTGFRLAVRRPERITAIVTQSGNAYEEGLSDGWNPIHAYWEEPTQANRDAIRTMLRPETTVWHYTHGVTEPSLISPDGYTLDNHAFKRDIPAADVQLLDTGHFALETHVDEIATAIRKFLADQQL